MAGNNGGNRQDNRQRGNAAQLLEKYKSMARDSQLAGDRVQTEYYLQFADHYFRMLGENRPRVDEQRRQRGDDDGDNDYDGDDRMDSDVDGDNDSDGDSDDQPQSQSPPQPQSQPQSQSQRGRSDEQPRRSQARPAADRSEPRRDRPNGRTRDEEDGRSRASARDDGDERIDFSVLPPAIGADGDGESLASVDDETPRPKRRVRRPRAAEGDETTTV